MKILFTLIIFYTIKTEVLKGNIYTNQCGCEMSIYSPPLPYTKFNKIAYAQYLTDQINFFHQKWVHNLSKVQQTDENIYGITIESLSSLTLDALTNDGINFQLSEVLPKNQNKNINLQDIQQELDKINEYFLQYTDEEKQQHNDMYFFNYFLPEMFKKPYIADKLLPLIQKIQIKTQKINDTQEEIKIDVQDDLNLEQSAIAFKMNLTVNGKLGLQHVSFVLLHLISFESKSTQYYFKNEVYYFEIDNNIDFNQQKISVNLNNSVKIEDYIHNKQDYTIDQPKKLDFQNFYVNPGLREVQQSCISSSSGIRAGIGAALSNLVGFYYGYYNTCLNFSILDDKITQKGKLTFRSFTQTEQSNIFGILDSFDNSLPIYLEPLDKKKRFAFVENIFAQNKNNLLRQTVQIYFDTNVDNTGQNFQYGCKTFKESFDYNIQNAKFSIFIYFIQGSNFLYIDCDHSNTEIGYLVFQGKKIMKLNFTTYLSEDGSSETCFRSQFLMPQLLKSSLMCLKKPEKEQLQEIYDKTKSYLSFYYFYYKQPLQEIFNVTEILQDMVRNTLSVQIIYEALITPFFQDAKKLDPQVQELIQKGNSEINMPFLQYRQNGQKYQSKRGSIISISFFQNPLATFRIKIIEGEEEFLKLIFTDGSQEKEYLFSKFMLTDNVDIIRDFKRQNELEQKQNQGVHQILQQRYLTDIAKYLKEKLESLQIASSKDVQSLQKDNYKLDTSDGLMAIYSSLDFVGYQQAVGITMYQLLQTKFTETFMDKEIEDYVFKPVSYFKEDIQLDQDIGLTIKQPIAYSENKLEANYKNIQQAFNFSRRFFISEDQKEVRSFQYDEKEEGKKQYTYDNLQSFIDNLYQTESQSQWLFLEDKQEIDRLSNDYFLYFHMDPVMTGGILNEVQKKNFLESFIIGVDKYKTVYDLNFLLGDRESNRYLIVSFGSVSTEYLNLIQLTFFSIYFKSQFYIQLSDFQSLWSKLFDIITSVASHYKQIAEQSFDMTLEGQDITMDDIKELILEEQKKFELNFFSEENKDENSGELEGITYLMSNSNQKQNSVPNELKDQKIVLTVSKKQFPNKRNGYIMRFFNSKLPITEQENQQYIENNAEETQHGQLEFYNSYNFDYLQILSKFVEENLKKYHNSQNQLYGQMNCSDRSGIVLEIDNFVFTQLQEILNRDILPNFLQRELADITNQSVQQFQSFEEGQRKEFTFNSIHISSFEISYLGINENDEIEISFKDLKFFIDADIKLQVTKYVVYGKYYNFFGQIQLSMEIDNFTLTFDFKKFMQQEPYPQIQFKNTNIKIDVSRQKFGFNFSNSNFMINWTGKITQYTVNKDFIKNLVIRNTLDYMIDVVEQKMTNIINNIIRSYYPEQINITHNIYFSTKMICQPQFGGQKHKRIRIYMDAEIYDLDEIQNSNVQQINQQSQENQDEYQAQNFIKLMLSQKNFKDTLELFINQILKKELLAIVQIEIDNNEREITLENQVQNLQEQTYII